MKKLTLLVVALVAIIFANCDWKKGVSSLAKSVTGVDDANYDYAKGIVGTDAGDFENTFDKLIEKKGIKLDTLQIYFINTTFRDKPCEVKVFALDDKEKNTLKSAEANYDNEHLRYLGGEMIVLKTDEGKRAKYEQYQDLLFSYPEVKPLVAKLPEMIKAVKEKANSTSYISEWQIERDQETLAFTTTFKTAAKEGQNIQKGDYKTFVFDAEGKLVSEK